MQNSNTLVPLSTFQWDKSRKTLQCNSDVFNPGRKQQFSVVSEHTGKVLTFVPDVADMMAHEHYDGEITSWKPVEPCSGVQRLFITNW